MKLTVGLNLGDYEIVRIESGEYDTIEECRAELKEAIQRLENPRPEGWIP